MMPLPEKFMERMRRELGAAEADAQQAHGATHDYAEGRAAFIAKRPAHFLGR